MLYKDVVVEILHEKLGQDVEVLLVVMEKDLYQVINFVDICEGKLVFCYQRDDV